MNAVNGSKIPPVKLDVEYRHALIQSLDQSVTVPQLQSVVELLISQQAQLQLRQVVNNIFAQYLPFALDRSGNDSQFNVRASIKPMVEDFIMNTDRNLTETAKFVMTEQQHRIVEYFQSPAANAANRDSSDDTTQLPDHQKLSHSVTTPRDALRQWVYRLINEADRQQLVALDKVLPDIIQRYHPTRKQSSHQTKAAIQPVPGDTKHPCTSTISSKSTSHDANSDGFLQSVTSNQVQSSATKPAQSPFACASIDVICHILSFIPLPEMLTQCALVSHQFFDYCYHSRTWALIQQLTVVDTVRPVALTALLSKASRVRRIEFTRGCTNDQLACLMLSSDVSRDNARIEITSALRNLREIVLDNCVHITDDAFSHLSDGGDGKSSLLDQITTMRIISCNRLTEAGLIRLFKHTPHLRTLEVVKCSGLSSSVVQTLTQHCAFIIEIRLTGCSGVTDSALNHIANSATGRELTSLDISDCWTVSSTAILKLGARCRSLKSLNLTGCYSSVNEQSLRGVVQTNPLSFLYVRGCNVGDSVIDIVTHTLNRNLQLIDCSVPPGAFGVAEITDNTLGYLTRCSNLTSLDISGSTKLTDKGVRALTDSINQLLCVNISRCSQLTSLACCYFAGQRRLQTFDASFCPRVDDSGPAYLLANCFSLTTVRLNQCIGVTDKTLRALSKTYHRQLELKKTSTLVVPSLALRTLELARCAISNRGLISFSLLIASHVVSVSTFVLGNCLHVTDDGVAVLLRAMPSLTNLNLYGCANFTDQSLISMSQHSPHLTTLNLTYCSQITDNGVIPLTRGCALLSELYLEGLSLITDLSLNALGSNLMGLTILKVPRCTLLSITTLHHVTRQCAMLQLMDVTLIPAVSQAANSSNTSPLHQSYDKLTKRMNRRGATLILGLQRGADLVF